MQFKNTLMIHVSYSLWTDLGRVSSPFEALGRGGRDRVIDL